MLGLQPISNCDAPRLCGLVAELRAERGVLFQKPQVERRRDQRAGIVGRDPGNAGAVEIDVDGVHFARQAADVRAICRDDDLDIMRRSAIADLHDSFASMFLRDRRRILFRRSGLCHAFIVR